MSSQVISAAAHYDPVGVFNGVQVFIDHFCPEPLQSDVKILCGISHPYQWKLKLHWKSWFSVSLKVYMPTQCDRILQLWSFITVTITAASAVWWSPCKHFLFIFCQMTLLLLLAHWGRQCRGLSVTAGCVVPHSANVSQKISEMENMQQVK